MTEKAGKKVAAIKDTAVPANTAISLLKVTHRCVMYITKNFGAEEHTVKKWEAIFKKHEITFTPFEG